MGWGAERYRPDRSSAGPWWWYSRAPARPSPQPGSQAELAAASAPTTQACRRPFRSLPSKPWLRVLCNRTRVKARGKPDPYPPLPPPPWRGDTPAHGGRGTFPFPPLALQVPQALQVERRGEAPGSPLPAPASLFARTA